MACGCRRPQARAAAAATAFPALLLALPLLALLGFPCARACTSVIVGPGATVDGDIFIARSDDGEDTTTSNNVSVYPARNGPAVFKANGNNFNIKLPGPGLTYLALPIISADPSQGRNASSEASGINSAGVAISATESIYNSKAALAADPYVGDTGMVEDAIPSVLLPQARSAREAMEILGRIVEEKGAGEGFGVLAADYEEAWYIETAGGHHWMALRVPHDSFFVSANQGRFQEANLSDAANVLHSPGLEKFAIRAGLYNPAQGHPLNFFDAFMDNGRAQATYSYPRVRELQQRFGGKAAGTQLSPHRPVFMPASHKVSLAEVQASLRNHFDGSEHDAYRRRDPQEPFRPVAVLRSGNGHVSQLRPALAGGQLDALSAINWVAWAMPALSPFVPLYKGLTHDMLPKELTSTAVEPDDVSLFWKARRLQALVFQDWPKLAPNATAAILAWEHDVQARQQPRFERRYAAAGRGSGRAAARLLAAYTRRVVRQAADLLEQLTAQAAEHLGLPGVPDDAEVQHLLDVALSTYGFMPPEDKDKDLQARVSRPRVAALSKFLGAAPAVASA